jgi:hypothetical protein
LISNDIDNFVQQSGANGLMGFMTLQFIVHGDKRSLQKIIPYLDSFLQRKMLVVMQNNCKVNLLTTRIEVQQSFTTFNNRLAKAAPMFNNVIIPNFRKIWSSAFYRSFHSLMIDYSFLSTIWNTNFSPQFRRMLLALY